MEDFIAEIYSYAELYTKLRQGVEEIRQNRMTYAKDFFNDVYENLCACCKVCLEESFIHARELSKGVIGMSGCKNDFLLLGDHIEEYVLPFLKEWIGEMSHIDVVTEDGKYRIVSSRLGYLTIQICESGKYIHSAYDPMKEAERCIKSRYDPVYSEYILYGCGMGYYAYQLYMITDGSARIVIYEKDQNLLEYARQYGVLDWIPEDVLSIKIGEKDKAFIEHSLHDNVKAIFHIAEIDTSNSREKEQIYRLCIGENTAAHIAEMATLNFYRNIAQKLPDVSEMKEQVLEDVVIVAAGPSLDNTLDFLRRCKGKKTIIAVNTVFRKLVQNGIKPDFVVVLDASKRMIKHLRGVEHEAVPLIVDLCVYWRWCYEDHGPKYIVYSTYSCKKAEEYIKKNEKEKWPSGGTVTFLALEFALRKSAKRIYLVGCDLGYPEGRTHAADTAYAETTDKEMIDVERVGGGTIPSDYVFGLFRSAIETRIEQTGNAAVFYNLSTIGARIKGTKECTPDEVIP